VGTIFAGGSGRVARAIAIIVAGTPVTTVGWLLWLRLLDSVEGAPGLVFPSALLIGALLAFLRCGLSWLRTVVLLGCALFFASVLWFAVAYVVFAPPTEDLPAREPGTVKLGLGIAYMSYPVSAGVTVALSSILSMLGGDADEKLSWLATAAVCLAGAGAFNAYIVLTWDM
jgi:hypothetical protein